jgi:hypothetical protein
MFDFVCKISDKGVRVRMTSQAEGMCCIIKASLIDIS